MSKVQEIQAAIESLPKSEYTQLREWFLRRDWAEWDKQIERDSDAGKLDFLIEEAMQEKAKSGYGLERMMSMTASFRSRDLNGH